MSVSALGSAAVYGDLYWLNSLALTMWRQLPGNSDWACVRNRYRQLCSETHAAVTLLNADAVVLVIFLLIRTKIVGVSL